MKSLIFEWLWSHRPDMAVICMFACGISWAAVSVNNFDNRLTTAERELPEIRAEMKEIRTEMHSRFEEIDERFEEIDERFEEIHKRFDRIELTLNTVVTYLSVKK